MLAGPKAQRARERQQQHEDGVDEHRTGEDETANQQRDARAAFAEQRDHAANDLVGGAALEQTDTDDSGHRDGESEPPHRDAGFAHHGIDDSGEAVRICPGKGGQQPNDDSRQYQRKERMKPEHANGEDDERDADRQNGER